MRILVTGYTGMVGRQLYNKIGRPVTLLGRKKILGQEHYFASFAEGESYQEALDGVYCVVHCAARVHVMQDLESNPLEAFRQVNTRGTMNLARQAALAGVKRFSFISSIKVNGEVTRCGEQFKYDDTRNPQDDYAVSKSEAELQLLALSMETGMEVVIIRPPLVYGEGVKGNFASLINLVSKGLPLPFGRIVENKRSLVSVSNLVDLILTCIDHPKAANQVFLVSDDEDLSTSDIVRNISKSLNVANRMLPVPIWCFVLVGFISRKQDVVNRLIGSLQVDISHTKNTLGWVPSQSISEAFKASVEAYKKLYD